MKSEQFSHRIGNIEDRLIEEAENVPNFGRAQRVRSVRRMVLIAAAIVLMAGSFTIGAFAMQREPETIIIEVPGEAEIVFVEREQEIILVGDSGISLILTDLWVGKYGVEIDGDTIAVYLLSQRNDGDSDYNEAGYLFWVDQLEGVYPMDYIYPEPGYTIAVTNTSTYRLRRASDIQYDINNAAIASEYDALSQNISEIQILLTGWIADENIRQENIAAVEEGAVASDELPGYWYMTQDEMIQRLGGFVEIEERHLTMSREELVERLRVGDIILRITTIEREEAELRLSDYFERAAENYTEQNIAVYEEMGAPVWLIDRLTAILHELRDNEESGTTRILS